MSKFYGRASLHSTGHHTWRLSANRFGAALPSQRRLRHVAKQQRDGRPRVPAVLPG